MNQKNFHLYSTDDFILDEDFRKIVKESGFSDRLKELLERLPEKKYEINLAVKILQSLQVEDFQQISQRKAELWDNIIQEQKRKVRFFYLRVAASLLLFLGIGSALFYIANPKIKKEIAIVNEPVLNNSTLVLADGKKVSIGNKQSKIRYSPDGASVTINDTSGIVQNVRNEKFNQMIVPYSKYATLQLSDGTKVWLNAGSRLVYPPTFTGKYREVYLQGEGYFDVTKNPAKPFIVKTDFMNIKVLGTVFNISAYNDEPTVYAVLVEGKVEVTQRNRLFGTTEKNLSPGQGCFYSIETKTSAIRKIELYDYTSWKDGLFYFKDKPLNYIVARLKKYYNQNILIDEGKLPNTLISGKLVLSDNLEEVMKYLTKTLEARYDKNKDGGYIIKN